MNSIELDQQQACGPGDVIIGNRALAAWEIASVTSSILIAEWILSAAAGQTKMVVAVPISLAFAFMICSHRLRGEKLRDLGFRFDNFLSAGRLLLLPMAVASVLCLLIGWWAGERMDFLRWHAERPIVGQLVLGFGWGFVQQYVLQSFMNRRVQIMRGRNWFSVVIVAVIFAGLHFPNPWLTVVTLAGGLVWASVYQRAPNIFALALSHSVMTWILVSTLPASTLNHLRIGFKYFT